MTEVLLAEIDILKKKCEKYEQAIEDIKAEIDNQYKWLMQTKHTLCDIDIAFEAIKAVVDRRISGKENE